MQFNKHKVINISFNEYNAFYFVDLID